MQMGSRSRLLAGTSRLTLIGGPLPFKMDVKVRDEKRAARIKHWYEESVADEEAGKIQQY